MSGAVGFVEVNGWSAGMVILDAMEKSAQVRLIQAELNDRPGVCLKVEGDLASVRTAVDAAAGLALSMRAECVTDVIARPEEKGRPAWEPAPDFNILFEQATVHLPAVSDNKERPMDTQAPFAVGLIETQGFTAVFEAIDTAVKTANVEVLAREKLGGGYITVLIKGGRRRSAGSRGRREGQGGGPGETGGGARDPKPEPGGSLARAEELIVARAKTVRDRRS